MLSQLINQKKWRDAFSCFTVIVVLVYSFRILPTVYSSIIFFFIFALFFLFLKKKFGLHVFFLFISSFIGGLVFSAKSGFTEGYFSILSPIISLGLAAGLYFIRNDKKYPKVIAVFLLIILMILLTLGRFHDVNYLDALRGSKNHIATYALSLWFLTAYFFRDELNFKVSFFFLMLFLVAATLSTSLGAIFVALSGLSFYLFFKNKIVFLFITVVIFLVFYNISFHTLDWIFQIKLVEKFYRGSTRLEIWNQFLSDFSFIDIFVGRFESFSTIVNGYYFENLHSSFFLGVSKYGYIIITFQYFMAITLLFSKKIEMLVKTFILMILIRSLYDTVLFSYGYIDWVFYLLMFHLDENKKVRNFALLKRSYNMFDLKGSS